MIIIWILSIFFLFDSIFRAIRSNFNLGSGMMYAITVFLWIYVFFHKPIDSFLSSKLGFWVKVLFFLGCAFMLCMMLFIAISGYSDKPTGREKSVIVLGAGLRGTKVSGVLARRLNAAYDFYLENPDIVIVVTGGQGPQEAIPEATAMQAYLVGKGVPSHKIIVEDKSTSTEENFAFAKVLLEQHGISTAQPMAFSTNNFHCYRAGKYAESVGFSEVNAIPASIGFESVLPCYLREVLAVLYYWVWKQ